MSADLVLHEFDFGVPGVQVDRLGLSFRASIEYPEWEAVGAQLGVLRDLSAWWLGDFLNAGEELFGERVVQGAEATGRSPISLLEFARVARRFPLERRRVALSWSHHQVVAALDPAEADEWLDRAEAERWNVAELRGAVRSPRRLGVVIAEEARQAVERRELVEDAARALLAAVAPADKHGLYLLVPTTAIERLRDVLDS